MYVHPMVIEKQEQEHQVVESTALESSLCHITRQLNIIKGISLATAQLPTVLSLLTTEVETIHSINRTKKCTLGKQCICSDRLLLEPRHTLTTHTSN